MIPLFKPYMSKEVDEKLSKLLYSGFIGCGSKVVEFEKELEKFLHIKNKLVTTNSCTSALHLALYLCNIKKGDVVISTPITCSATNTPIVHTGAKIRWCDVEKDTGNIDTKKLERLIDGKVKAIVFMHWGGNPCDLNELSDISIKYNIPIIEDAAHAFGSKYYDNYIGYRGSNYTCLSFQAVKNLNTGDGGALICPLEQYDRIKKLRWYGMDRSLPGEKRLIEDFEEAGFKYNMIDINAQIGLCNLKDIEYVINKTKNNSKKYNEIIDNCKHIKRVRVDTCKDSNYWLYTIFPKRPGVFKEFMNFRKIQTSKVHIRNDYYTCFINSEDQQYESNLEGVEYFNDNQINIPNGWWLSEEEVNYVCESLIEYDNMWSKK